jgi:SmpA / OmlA family
MPTRRRLLALGLLVAGVALGAALTRHRSVVTEENLDRIQDGMTSADVEAVLGTPHEVVPVPSNHGEEPRQPPLAYWDESLWWGPGDQLIIQFNESGRVQRKDIFRAGPDERTFKEKVSDELRFLRRKLGW